MLFIIDHVRQYISCSLYVLSFHALYISPGEIKSIKDHSNSKVRISTANAGGGSENTFSVWHDMFSWVSLFLQLIIYITEQEIKLCNCSFFCLQGSSVLSFDRKHWPAKDGGPGFVIVANSKSLLERKEIFAGTLQYGTLNLTEWYTVNLYSSSVICVYFFQVLLQEE